MNLSSLFGFALAYIFWCQIISAQQGLPQGWPSNIPYPADFPIPATSDVTFSATSTMGNATYYNPASQIRITYYWEESFATESSSGESTTSSNNLRLRRKWVNSQLKESRGHHDVTNTNATSTSHGGDWLKIKYNGRVYSDSQGLTYISEETSFSVAYKSFFLTNDPVRKAMFMSIAEGFPVQTSPQSFTTSREEFRYDFKNVISTNEWILERSFSSKYFPDNATQDFEDKPKGNFPNSGGTGSMIPLALIDSPRLDHFFPVQLFITETDPFAVDSYLSGDFPTPRGFSPEDWNWGANP